MITDHLQALVWQCIAGLFYGETIHCALPLNAQSAKRSRLVDAVVKSLL